MEEFIMGAEHIQRYKVHLVEEERSQLTIEKYLRDVNIFQCLRQCPDSAGACHRI